MSKCRAVIQISPTRVEVAAVRGTQVLRRASERLALNLAEDWVGSMGAVLPVLKRLVEKAEAQGAFATVLYSSTSAAVGVFSCPRAAGSIRATDAAMLALAEAASFPLEANCSDHWTIASDRSGGPSVQTHTLAVADADAALSALQACVVQAGLRVEAMVPTDAPLLAEAVTLALGMAEGEKTAIVLSIREHSSILAAAVAGRLKFARQIALGSESLVEAIAREIRPAGGEPVTLTSEQAREILGKIGIPTREQVALESPRVAGDALLPLLQPVLQRWVVETRQSIRFGLEETERAGAGVHTLGTGAGIPRLCSIITDQLGLPLNAGIAGGGPSDEIDAWLGAKPRLELIPRRAYAERAGRRLRRAMLIGAVGAAALTIADGVLVRADLARRTVELQQSKARLEDAKTVINLRERTIAEQTALALAQKRMNARLGESPAWDAAMALLAEKTPASVKLADVQFVIEHGQPLVRINGRTPMSDQGDSKAALKQYMDALSTVPMVRSCKLGATQRGETEAGPVQTFEMMLVLVPLPAEPAAPAHWTSATDSGEGQ